MELSNYPLEDLQTLQMAVAIAFEMSKKDKTVTGYCSLLTWSVDIDQAIKDRAFADEFNFKTYVEVAQEIGLVKSNATFINKYRQFDITRAEYGGFHYAPEWSDGSEVIPVAYSIEDVKAEIDAYWNEHADLNEVMVTVYDKVSV